MHTSSSSNTGRTAAGPCRRPVEVSQLINHSGQGRNKDKDKASDKDKDKANGDEEDAASSDGDGDGSQATGGAQPGPEQPAKKRKRFDPARTVANMKSAWTVTVQGIIQSTFKQRAELGVVFLCARLR